jgi:exopolysaccharide biosynthesis polyprenyl glycosylphosphotransferase
MNMSRNYFKWNLLLLDFFALGIGSFLYYKFAPYFLIPTVGIEFVLPILGFMVVLMFSLFDLYTDWRRKDIHNLIYSIVLSMFALYVVVLLGAIFIQVPFNSHLFILTLLIVETLLMVLLRAGLWILSKRMVGERKVIIIGENMNASYTLAEKFLNHNDGWYNIMGVLTEDNNREITKAVKANDVVVLGSGIKQDFKTEIVDTCIKQGKEVLVVPQSLDFTVQGAVTQQVDDMMVFSLSSPAVSNTAMALKRIFDLAVSTILLICVSPLILFLFIIIPLTSKGPVIFRQERVGQYGRSFWIYKFRSMIHDAEKMTGPVLASEKDPRITPFGRFMRAVRLDELPQLFNVLKGDMSLVGPRPERDYFIRQFKQELPDYTLRLTVKPGITGLAQVMGNYSTTVENKLVYDLLYIRNYSLMLDIKILMQTVRVVVQRKQAKGVTEQKVSPMVDMKKKSNVVGR